VLVSRRLQIEAPTVVRLTVWRARAPIVKLNGRSRLKHVRSRKRGSLLQEE
jgi:hypothetical protein